MRLFPIVPFALGTNLLSLAVPLTVHANTEHFWNVDETGGDGIWGTGPGEANWNTAVGAVTPNISWPNTTGSVAVFQDNIGGTAVIFGTVSASGVSQRNAGYEITAGTLNLIPGSGGEQPFIEVASGTMSVSSSLTGANGFIKTGAGVLTISGVNSYTGATVVNNGTLVLAGPDQLPDGESLRIDGRGTLTLAAGETVGSVVSNGGTINGTGTLTAATYQLNGGTRVDANLGAGILTTNGAVALNGTSAAATVNVGSGALTLSGGNLADTAAVTLAAGGGVVMNGSDTVGSLVSNGGSVSGTGTLTAATYDLRDGTDVSGNLGNGAMTTNGTVILSGTAGSGSINVESGALHFTGTSGATNVEIQAGAILRDGGNLADTALLVNNGGNLFMQGPDTILRYTSNGGTLSGQGTLTAANYILGDGSSVSGNLGAGVLDSSGAVSITGTAAAAQVNVISGILSLDGDNLSDAAAVRLLAGATLMMDGADTVGSVTSDGGIIAGTGTLTAANYILNGGTQVTGSLGDGVLESHGTVESSGVIGASTIRIVDGSFVNSGTLGTAASHIDLGAGAWLVAGGTQNYARLTTAAGDVSGWSGNLTNTAIISPGDDGAAGTLVVQGDFSSTGRLVMDVGAASFDLLEVTGNTSFGGVLEVNQLGVDGMAVMTPLQIVQAATYSGNFSSMVETLDGVVFFNPTNGTLTRLGLGNGADFLRGVSPNQASTWTALYDDVIAPGEQNVINRPGQQPPYELTSGLASADAPGLLAALEASLSPAGLDRALLNRLSPEVYGSLSDYSRQALRNHHRSARNAATLAASGTPAGPVATGGAKDGGDAKGGVIAAPSAFTPAWEVFAAANYFDTGSDGSMGQADYDLSGTGILAGARFSPTRALRLSAWLSGDDGSVQGALIDADAKGFAAGLGAETFFPVSGREVRLSAGISYGTWEFDGSRGSAIAGGGVWSPAFSPFSNVDADAFEAFIGIDSVVWRNETFRVTPSLGLVFSSSSSDAFREMGAGAPIALVVDGAGRDSLAAQLGISADAKVNRFVTLDGEAGVQVALTEDTERISGRFAAVGSRPMGAILSPISDDLFYLGAGVTWHAGERCDVRLGYRAEFRSDEDVLNAVNLSTSVRF